MTPPSPAAAAPAALELDHVTFAYNGQPVIRDVSMSVGQGAFVALVGGNGAGKSTLVRLSLGLLRPYQGHVRLFGTEATQFRQWWQVGYVPQRAAADSALPISVAEVVRTGLAGQLRPGRRQTPRHRERMEHVLDVMGLTQLRGRRMSQLSGGQQQRALIARALLTEPRLLILDEPTTGVDADARAVLRASLEHLAQVEQVAVVYVSHDPETFAGLATCVVELRAGEAFCLRKTGSAVVTAGRA